MRFPVFFHLLSYSSILFVRAMALGSHQLLSSDLEFFERKGENPLKTSSNFRILSKISRTG